jgi:putative flippase GtrA
MAEDVAAVPTPLPARLRRGLRTPAAWWQLGRFALVGASGYAVNLAVFSLGVHTLALHYRAAAVLAFAVALANNFLWNRHWTFTAAGRRAGRQAARFVAVSLAAFVLAFAALQVLVGLLGMASVPAQALAVAAAMPVNFLLNKLWSFA